MLDYQINRMIKFEWVLVWFRSIGYAWINVSANDYSEYFHKELQDSLTNVGCPFAACKMFKMSTRGSFLLKVTKLMLFSTCRFQVFNLFLNHLWCDVDLRTCQNLHTKYKQTWQETQELSAMISKIEPIATFIVWSQINQMGYRVYTLPRSSLRLAVTLGVFK